MLIIPVIDLYAGHVVHARAGQRRYYKNIQTPLCHGSNPSTVVNALLALHPFSTVYIADLNAIKDAGNNNRIIIELLHRHPEINFWLDAGQSSSQLSSPGGQLRRIVGSETGVTDRQLLSRQPGSDIVLSLDYFAQKLIGDNSVLENTHAWPDDIIVMSLNRVGTGHGPDFSLIKQIQKLAGDKHIFVAGGVRDGDDLDKLHAQKVAGVLLATALHQGKISNQALNKYSEI